MRYLSIVAVALAATASVAPAIGAQPRQPALSVPLSPLSGTPQHRPEPAPRPDPRRAFDAYVEAGMRDWHVPGLVVAIVDGDSVVFQKAYGVRDVTTHDPVDLH